MYNQVCKEIENRGSKQITQCHRCLFGKTSKICKVCAIEKPLIDFYKGRTDCKQCHNEYYNLYYNRGGSKQENKINYRLFKQKLKTDNETKGSCESCGQQNSPLRIDNRTGKIYKIICDNCILSDNKIL